MTLYLNLPSDTGKLEHLIGLPGTEVLPGPPSGLDEIPAGKALVCVADMGAYEAAGYLVTEGDFAAWRRADDDRPETWLLMERQAADDLCPGAEERREAWRAGIEADAEAAAHTDNLVPVGRASRSGITLHIEALRTHAKALRGDRQGSRSDDLLVDPGVRRVAAADLTAAADALEEWIRHDWVAIIDVDGNRQHLAGPLPPFPG